MFTPVLVLGENIYVKDLNTKQGKKLFTMTYIPHIMMKKRENLDRIVKLTKV